MITVDQLMAIEKDDLQEAAKVLEKEDLPQLVEWLNEKDDKLRYQALLLLQNRSQLSEDVYPYWDTFQSKFKSDNSYQRSIGLMMIAENVRWDQQNKMDQTIDDYLMILQDEKPITVRQCIQTLSQIVEVKPTLTLGIVPNGLKIVLTNNCIEKFVVFERKNWIKEICNAISYLHNE
jgi:hypothetical protein